MAGEWFETTLGDLIDIRHGFSFKGQFIHEEPSGDVLLTPGNFAVRGGFKGDKFKYYDGSVSDEFVLSEGDLLVTMTDLSKQSDTLGYPAFVPAQTEGHRYLHNQRLGKFSLRRPAETDLRYIYYVMCGEEYRHEVLASATGTTVKHTSPDRIKRFRFRVAPLPEQRAIAHILGTLDEKIELNRRMNETLETMTRALFKSWFVDFDPVRAKMEGRWRPGESLPGLPAHLYDHFPDELVDSALGKIPEGWEVTALADVAETIKGRSYKSAELAESTTALVTLKSFARRGGYRPDGLKAFTGTFKPEQVVKPGEVVVACTDVTQAAEVIGRSAIVQPDPRFATLVASLDMVIVRPTPKVGRAFLYFLMRMDPFVDYTFAHTTGTTVLHLAKDAIPSFSFACPSRKVVTAFESLALSTLERVQHIGEESGTPAALRDTLLPKLISGELRVEAAEKFIGRTV